MAKFKTHMSNQKSRTGWNCWTLCGMSINDLVPGFTRNGNLGGGFEWTDCWRGVTCKLCLRRRKLTGHGGTKND